MATITGKGHGLRRGSRPPPGGGTSTAVAGAVLLLAGLPAAPGWATGTTERVSLGPGGAQSRVPSHRPAISADGRFVAFDSRARALVPGDTNGVEDVFVRDRRTGRTERISLGIGGAQPDDTSNNAAISAAGRFVAFESIAANLVPGDTNRLADVFVRDRQGRTTERVSVGAGGAQSNGVSSLTGISAGGRYVAFVSFATNLVPGDTNRRVDVFLHDRLTDRTERVSLGAGGAQTDQNSFDGAVSAGGRYVAFSSYASDLAPGDTNRELDVFVRDRQAGTTERVSVGPGGVQAGGPLPISARPTISADGRFVAFDSLADNLVPGDTNGASDVFVRDRRAGRTQRVSGGPGDTGPEGSFGARLSATGRFVAFVSEAGNLVPGDANFEPDVFLHDRRTARTERVSLGAGDREGDGISAFPALSADGRHVAFRSIATNLVPGDTNSVADIFVRTR